MSGTCLLPFAPVQAASPETGITGTVRLWPGRPGPQREGDPGTTPYLAAPVELRDTHGAIIARTTADDSGRFRVLAPPGRYDVLIKGARLPRCKAVTTEVRDGEMANVDITCDSGMR